MPTSSFTTRIDSKLKSALEEIAQYEDRSASYIANQAISAFVEERKQTHELVRVGLQLVDKGISISETAIDDWLSGDENAAFPKPDISA